MKKIAIVTNTSWNILNFRTSLIKELQKQYEILLVAPKDEYSEQIEVLSPTVFLTKLSRKGTNPIKDLQLVKELKEIYKRQQVDLALHFTIKPNIYGSMAAKQARIPSIAVVTGLGYTFLSNGIAAKAAKMLYKHAFQKNNLTVFQNGDDRSLFIDLNLVQKNKSMVINGSGIDVNYFKSEKGSVEQRATKNEFHFLFVGRLLNDKGVRELFGAYRTVFGGQKDVFLHIVGDIDQDNPSAITHEELKNELVDGNILYHGRQDDVKQFITQSDCVVLPSYREGLPRVMLEAISMSKPVITTDVPGCRETVVDGENGFLVQVQSVEDLGQKLKMIYELDPESRKHMGQNGRELAIQKFSSEVINQEFVNQLHKILGN